MEIKSQHTNILILGAGIGGYETFRTLSKLLKKHGLNQVITIVDRNNYFTFTPLLHEVASGAVEPSHCALPLREIIYKTPHKFIKADVQKIDPEKKVVTTSAGDIAYDYCVMSLGSGVNFLGVPGATEHCYTVRTLDEAMRLREMIIKKLEDTRNITAITVVGGGFSGVEVAGQLAHLIKRDFKKLYPNDTVMISLVESGKTILPQAPLKAQQNILRRLAKMGVTVRLGTVAKEVAASSVLLGSGIRIQSDITVWCAGVSNVAERFLPREYCERGRLPVMASLLSAKADTLYGVGDVILGHNVGSDAPFFPQLGEAAHRQGEYVARHITDRLSGKLTRPFFFKSKGLLMPIGERYGVAIFGKVIITGLLAWWLRRTVYVLFMPGLIFKFKLVIDWTLRLFGFSYIISIERNKKN
ncbi:MAG: NAD(P)/FAD-dependent oxidoreductase [Candidatus Magasanikbacteria bacterium]|nr:NAD(P)/FAD-dependent oxidoreductase [Candidatus Magasanikbacteria bacterium]